jgi:hypothetical protein
VAKKKKPSQLQLLLLLQHLPLLLMLLLQPLQPLLLLVQLLPLQPPLQRQPVSNSC